MIIMFNKMERQYLFRPRRTVPVGIEGIIMYMDFNSGYIITDKYLPITGFINNTSNNFKKDPNGFGGMIEFDGIVERIQLPNTNNPLFNFAPNEKFTVFCRFRVLTPTSNGFIFGRSGSNGFMILDVDFSNIKLFMLDDSGFKAHFDYRTFDTNWHTMLFGFDGNTWFSEFDGNRIINSDNSHGGFNEVSTWSMGASPSGSEPTHLQISEVGIIKGASL